MTLQRREDNGALLKHSSATNNSQVGQLMVECCCSTVQYVEFMTCSPILKSSVLSCTEAQRTYHCPPCSNADASASACCQLGIGDCSSFSGNDELGDAYENNCSGNEQKFGGAHNGTKRRHCAAVYMNLVEFLQTPIGPGGSTFAQKGWYPGGSSWPLGFKINGVCMVGGETIRTETQIDATTDSSGTNVPACSKIRNSAFDTDCAGDIMVNDAAGMAISAGALNMGPNVSLADADIQDICAHCCQHNWINTHDCHPCPGASNCDVADNDSAAFVSAERAAGFRLCQCSGLGTSDGPTQEDMRGLFMGFANGTSNTNCAGTQAVKIDTGCGTIENPANYRSGASACPAELSLGTDNAGGHPCNSGYPDGVENHAFFMSGDYSGAFFDCGPRNCDNPPFGDGDGTIEAGETVTMPQEACAPILCETPACGCGCTDCGGGCDFAECPKSYTIAVGDIGVGSATGLNAGGDIPGASVSVLSNSPPGDCNSSLFVPCVDGALASGDNCLDNSTNRDCGAFLSEGSEYSLLSDGSGPQVKNVLNYVQLQCGPLATCAQNPFPADGGSGHHNGFNVTVSFGTVAAADGPSPNGDFTAVYRSFDPETHCAESTYKLCTAASQLIDPFGRQFTPPATITVS